MTNVPVWHRVENEEQLEALIRNGWTEFTIRPYGSRQWIYITEELFDKKEACRCFPGFKQGKSTHRMVFDELMIAARFNHVCIPGPLTAHELAALEDSKSKRKDILTIDKDQTSRQDHSNLPVADGRFFVSEDDYNE